MGAFVTLFLEYLPQLVKAAQTFPDIIRFIQRTKATLSTTQEWSFADQNKYDQEVDRITSLPHWQPED